MEKCQTAIHDLIDVYARERITFQGITLTEIPVQYRDFGVSTWDVQIAPSGRLVEMGHERQEVPGDRGPDDGTVTTVPAPPDAGPGPAGQVVDAVGPGGPVPGDADTAV